jgi:signal transduction histidine kinase/Tfp pilus assembly protein PilF
MKVRTVLGILFLALAAQFAVAQPGDIDSLKARIQRSDGTSRIDAYQQLIINLWLNYPDTAMRYAREAIAYARQHGNVRDQSIAIRLVGGVHVYIGNYDSALWYSRRSYELSLTSGDSVLIASAMNNIGFTYYHLGSYPNALEYLLKSLDMKLRIRQNYGLGQTYNNLGLVYDKLKDYANARDNFNNAIRVSERLSDYNIRLYSFNNLGYTSLHENNDSLAMRYFRKALEASHHVNNKNWVATSYCGMADTYVRMEQLDSAQTWLQRSFALRKTINDRRGLAEIFYVWGKLCFRRNRINEAFQYVRRSQTLARDRGMRERRLDNLAFLTELHRVTGRNDSALYYQSSFLALRDSLIAENSTRDIAQVQMNVRDEENRRVLEAKERQLRGRTELAYLLLAIAVVGAAFFFLLYRSYRRQKRLSTELNKNALEIISRNKEIQEQKLVLMDSYKELEKAKIKIQDQNQELASLNVQLQNIVMLQTKELELTNHELKIANLELDNFIYRSSHDIKGPLVRLLGLCHVALIDVEDTSAREYITMFYDTAKHLNDLFDRLKIVSDINNVSLRSEYISTRAMVENVIVRLKTVRGSENVDIILDIRDDASLYSDPFLMETIIFDLAENAIRFQDQSRQATKFLKVSAYAEDSRFFMSFVDNGIGIRESERETIFQMFSRAALEHQTIGLGLYIVKQCVERLQGTIMLIPNANGFTEFRIVLPNNRQIFMDGVGETHALPRHSLNQNDRPAAGFR